jgi:hypothetical protein
LRTGIDEKTYRPGLDNGHKLKRGELPTGQYEALRTSSSGKYSVSQVELSGDWSVFPAYISCLIHVGRNSMLKEGAYRE